MFQQLSLRILPQPRLLHFRILSILLSGPKVFLFQTSSYHPSMSHHPRETFPSCPTPVPLHYYPSGHHYIWAW